VKLWTELNWIKIIHNYNLSLLKTISSSDSELYDVLKGEKWCYKHQGNDKHQCNICASLCTWNDPVLLLGTGYAYQPGGQISPLLLLVFTVPQGTARIPP
jgi:hypothetical protein